MMQSESALPHAHLPVLTEINRSFWQSGQDGVLRFSRCQACGYYIHPWAAACRRCHARDLTLEAVSGRATVKTFTINRHPWEASLNRPFIIAIVGLVEQDGLNLMTNIVNCALEAVTIDMPVKVAFRHVEDVWLPLFEPT
jgi:uncharacterized OB-fold protein